METVLLIWALLKLSGLLGVPQLLGVLVYFRLRKRHDFLAHLAGFLTPPLLFFYLSRTLLLSSAQELQAQGGRACGTHPGMMGLVIFCVAGLQMCFALIAQHTLHARHRTGVAR